MDRLEFEQEEVVVVEIEAETTTTLAGEADDVVSFEVGAT